MVCCMMEGQNYPSKEIRRQGGMQEVEAHTDRDEPPLEGLVQENRRRSVGEIWSGRRNERTVLLAEERKRSVWWKKLTADTCRTEACMKRNKLESNVGEGWPVC